MATTDKQSATKDDRNETERVRSISEGSNAKASSPTDRQRTLSEQQGYRGSCIKSPSPESMSFSNDDDSGTRLLVIDGDPESTRKLSSDSNSEFTFDTHDDSKYKGMVKSHYISTGTRSHCRQCNRKFSVKLRPHHCRRCGDIYCMKCLRYKRKLNKLANLDPNGKQRKVCKTCFNEDGGTLGCTRNLKEEFLKERQMCKHERVLSKRAASLTNAFWRDQLDMEKECERLLHGFSEAIGTSEAKRTLHEIGELVKPPKWQKSSFWQVEKTAVNCRACKGSLGLRKKKRNCKVCGLALCKKCSNKELLLYIDNGKAKGSKPEPKLGIIKNVGCPEKEPDISLLLHVCSDCKEYIIVRQTIPPSSGSLNILISMNEQFTELQSQISPSVNEVCKTCFNEDGGTLGCTRNLKEEFLKERQMCKHERVLSKRAASLTNAFWRDQLDMEKECERLLHGFSKAVGTSEAKKTLHEIGELVKPPKWQKSSFWQVEKTAVNCRACKGSLGLRKKKRNCKVCGLALCKKCSNKELLLYIDNGKAKGSKPEPKLGIIKNVGCPEKEPDISLLLHVCSDCKEYIIVRQTIPPSSGSLNILISMNEQFTELQSQISPSVNECERILESEEMSEKVLSSSSGRFLEILDQINKDLDEYEGIFQKLRAIGDTAETAVQKILFKNYTMAKYEFYMSNKHTYRKLSSKKEDKQNTDTGLPSTYKEELVSAKSKNKQKSMGDSKVKKPHKENIDKIVADEMETITAETNPHMTKLDDKTEETAVAVAKSTSSVFDKNLKKGSFPKNKSKKKIFQPKTENTLKEDNETEDSAISTGNNNNSKEHKKQSLKKVNEKIKIENLGSDHEPSKTALENNKDLGADHNKYILKAPDKSENSQQRSSGEIFLEEDSVSWKR